MDYTDKKLLFVSVYKAKSPANLFDETLLKNRF